MKKNSIILSLVAVGAFISLQSYNNGTQGQLGNRTGSNGGTTGCAACHGSQSSNTGVTIALTLNGNPVTEYTPGQTYTVLLAGTNINGNPKFGFQLVCGSANTSGSLYGTFNNAGVTGTSLKLNGQMVEHSSPLSGTVSGTNAAYATTFTWTAPAAGTGSVKFYAVLNAVNGNGNDDNNDKWNMGTSAVITEAAASSIKNVNQTSPLALYPNPAQSMLNIDLSNQSAAAGQVAIIDAMGRVVLKQGLAQGTQKLNLSIEHLSAGSYSVIVTKGAEVSHAKFVKQ